MLIRGGWIVTVDRHDRQLPVGDLLIEDGRITAVDTTITAPPGIQVIDATGMLVLPGLVDTHRHTWQTMVRHQGSAWSLSDYLHRMLITIGEIVRPEDVYAATLFGALSALDAGITTLVDWAHIQNSPAHADAGVRALTDAGIRAVFAHGFPVGRQLEGTLDHSADLRRVRRELLPDDDGLVTLAMGARGPDFSDFVVTARDFAYARELGIPITAHVSTGPRGDHHRGIELLADAGLLGPDLTLVHVTGASDEAVKLLAEYGVAVSVSPQIELGMPELGSGTALNRLLAAGVRPGLSVDSETAAAGDLFTQMRIALADHRSRSADDEPRLTADEVPRMATVDGARTAGLGERTGALEVGRAGDVMLVRANDPNLAPVTEPADAVVLAAHPGNVDTVLVAGRVVKRDGRLVGDLERARSLLMRSAAHVNASVSI